ncbi:MAG: Bug family tripartite tricarboxylate transporter substrate binding protein [Beijerinckiaceae bacterium]
MIIDRRSMLALAGASAAGHFLPGSAFAQTGPWPNKLIKAMVPFSAGSSVDVIGRIVLDELSRRLGQSIVIENRGGAGGTIGSAAVARAPADGYTLLINASAHSAAPAAYPRISYDPAKDFSSVISLGSIPNVVIVNPDKGYKTLQDLVERGRKQELFYSSAGVGSATHWAAERLRISSGIKGRHVPFRGGPAATLEVVAGRVDFACMGMSSALPLVSEGKVKALAVCTPKRSSAMPGLPTTTEAGFKDSDYTFWNAMFVKAGTPREIVDRLYRETTAVLALPQVASKLKPQGVEPMDLTPPEFDALIAKEIALNKALVKAAGLKFN